MAKKIVAIIGTYRKGRVIDTAACEVLAGAESQGCRTEKFYLIDKHIEFCTNCRACTQEPDVGRRGRCVLNDDMEEILDAVDRADGLVLASPTNFYNATAVTRRFMERLVAYAYWPWAANARPKLRTGKPDKKAVAITSTACPALIAKILMPGGKRALKIAAQAMNARVQKSLFYGGVAPSPEASLDSKDRQKAFQAGVQLAQSLA